MQPGSGSLFGSVCTTSIVWVENYYLSVACFLNWLHGYSIFCLGAFSNYDTGTSGHSTTSCWENCQTSEKLCKATGNNLALVK